MFSVRGFYTLTCAVVPFLHVLLFHFKQRNLYMVMEYLNGGDCFSLLRELQCFG